MSSHWSNLGRGHIDADEGEPGDRPETGNRWVPNRISLGGRYVVLVFAVDDLSSCKP